MPRLAAAPGRAPGGGCPAGRRGQDQDQQHDWHWQRVLRSGDGPQPRRPEVREALWPGAPSTARARAPQPGELGFRRSPANMWWLRGSLPFNFNFFKNPFSPSLFGSVSVLRQTCRALCKIVGQALKRTRRRGLQGPAPAVGAGAAPGPPCPQGRAAAGTGRAPDPAEGSAPPQSWHLCLRFPALPFGLRRLACPLFALCALERQCKLSLGSLRLLLGSPLIF